MGMAKMGVNWDSANTAQLTEGCCKEVKVVTADSEHTEQVSGSMWAGSSICFCEKRCGETLLSCLWWEEEEQMTEKDFLVHPIAVSEICWVIVWLEISDVFYLKCTFLKNWVEHFGEKQGDKNIIFPTFVNPKEYLIQFSIQFHFLCINPKSKIYLFL